MTDKDPAGDATERLLRLMAMLRDPEHGCRWDLKQRMDTLTSHTLEEVHEVIDAVENGSPQDIRGELGDLLFQVVFYARIASEKGWFDFSDVADGVFTKLVSRHPHVFPDGTLDSFGQPQEKMAAGQVENNWEAIKNAERERGAAGPVSVMDDVPRALPALQRAAKLQKRAASVGFDWSDSGSVLDKVQEELDELREAIRSGESSRQSDELGDLLFTCVNLSRHLKVDIEQSVRGCNRRFEQRFRDLERQARDGGESPGSASMETLEDWWRQARENTV
ncbi:MAG: nucleoside triphosphate pyrophosphohydrolase [Pseudohongiellaceae bacterium]